jgi:hypothetical protein
MRQHASIRFQPPLIPARMRRIFCSFVLLWLCYAFSAQAQVGAPPKPIPSTESHIFDDQVYRWWWGDTPTQVRDHILLEPGWQLRPLAEDDFHDPDFKQMMAYSEDEVVLIFSFYKGQLYRRAYDHPQASPLVAQWNTSLEKLPFDERESFWLDEEHHTQIKRIYSPGRVMYIAEINHKSANASK